MILSLLILICYIFPHTTIFADESDLDTTDVGIIILTQPNEYHDELFQKKKKEILYQANSLKQLQVKIYQSYDLQDDGHWIILPLLEKLYRSAKFGDQYHEWLFFLQDLTEVNLKYLTNVFQKYNSSEDVFVGYVLQDTDPTIIHHFANPASLSYPHFFAGFFVSSPLLQRLASKLPSWDEDYSIERSPANDEYSFSIDPMYELAKFIWDISDGVKLQHEEQLCLVKINQNCATWIKEEFPDCGLPLEHGKLHIGVKTCHKFHNDRIKVVKNTWQLEDNNIKIFSDIEDSLIPTIKVNVENVAHGHCEKTLSILKYYTENNISFDWLAIVDDDTLISIKRLRKLLACYNASVATIIGERYGYGVGYFSGYDYITGGGGMIFSLPVVKLVVAYCKCGSIDSPDDMVIGMCLKAMEIPVTHSPYFHQARPSDYSPYFLKPFKHISFHKHWMIDPYSVYKEWLQDSPDSVLHTEL